MSAKPHTPRYTRKRAGERRLLAHAAREAADRVVGAVGELERLEQALGLGGQAVLRHTMKAADNAGCREETHRRIHDVVAQSLPGAPFVATVLGRHLELS